MSKVYQYYLDNQETLENDFTDYISYKDWGSGDDKIKITDEIFFEWVADQHEKFHKMEDDNV
jgi:hypothetical protein